MVIARGRVSKGVFLPVFLAPTCTKFSKIVQITTVPVLLGHTKFSRSPNTCTGLVLYWQIAVYTLIVYQSWIGVLVSW